MIGDRRVLALIPARSGSKGLPNKNIRPLHGKPLLAWPIMAAAKSRLVDEVVLSTDSPEYAEIGRSFGARVPFLRPPELASDKAASIDVILHALDALAAEDRKFDYVILLEPTSPLTDADDIDGALARLDEVSDRADALVGVSQLITTHPAFAVRVADDGLISPYNAPDFRHLARRQDLEPLYCLDGSLYVSTAEALRRERGFCHSRTLGYVMPRHKAFEVDDLVDFVCVEAVGRHLSSSSSGPSDTAD